MFVLCAFFPSRIWLYIKWVQYKLVGFLSGTCSWVSSELVCQRLRRISYSNPWGFVLWLVIDSFINIISILTMLWTSIYESLLEWITSQVCNSQQKSSRRHTCRLFLRAKSENLAISRSPHVSAVGTSFSDTSLWGLLVCTLSLWCDPAPSIFLSPDC